MKTMRFALGPFLVLVFLAATSQAQNTFYVSIHGNDGLCVVTKQCRTISTALKLVQSGGEIVVQDSADYTLNGTVKITQAVSIIAAPGSMPA
jgi:hypothetical protein